LKKTRNFVKIKK